MSTAILLTSPIIPTIVRMAAPGLIAMVMVLVTSSAEAWYVGQLGTISLAGLALAFPMYMLTTMLSAGAMGGAVAGAVAQALGGNSKDEATSLALHTIIIALVASAFFAFLFLTQGRFIYGILGGTGAVLEQTLIFSDIMFAGCLSLWSLNLLTSIIRGCGHMRMSAVFLVMASVLQIIVGGLLILGVGPFPKLGIAGAAWAIVIGAGTGAACAFLYLCSGKAAIQLRFKGVPLRKKQFAHILKPGLLACISPISSISSAIVITALVARVGPEVLAGYGIGVRLEFLLIPVIFGIGGALITMVGVHFGAGEYERAHKVAWTGAFGAAAITGLIGGILAIFPDLWANIFTDAEAVREACRAYLRIAGPTYGFFGLGLSLYFASQGARRLFWPVISGVLRLTVVSMGGLAIVYFSTPTVENVFGVVAIGMIVFGSAVALAIKLGAWRRRLSAI